MTSFFEFSIKVGLDVFPDGIPIWSDDHGASDWAVVSQLSFSDNVKVPFAKVLRFGGDAALLGLLLIVIAFLLLLLLLFLSWRGCICGTGAADQQATAEGGMTAANHSSAKGGR